MSAPTFCYVVLAHTDPAGLVRLVARIRELSPASAILVRHEDPSLVGPEELEPLGALDLVSTVSVRWGGWTMVQAVVEAFAAALARTDADYVVLISGQDCPVRDLAEWEAEVVASGADALLDPMHAHPQTYGRHYYTFQLPGGPSLAKRAVHAAMGRFARLIHPRVQLYRLDRTGPDRWWFSVPRRGGSVPPPWFVKASQWMTLRRDVLEAVLEIAGPQAKGLRRVATMLIPDEIAVQSTVSQVATNVRHGSTSATSFDADAPSPEWLTPELVRELSTTRAPFARKMPVEGWEAVLAAADVAVVASRGERTSADLSS